MCQLPWPRSCRTVGHPILGLGTPLRFVYAVKDSVFEKIDAATANAAWTGETRLATGTDASPGQRSQPGSARGEGDGR